MSGVRSVGRVGREEVVEVAFRRGERGGGADIGFSLGVGFDGGIQFGGSSRGRHCIARYWAVAVLMEV